MNKPNAAGLIVAGADNPNWKGGPIAKVCVVCKAQYAVKRSHSKSKFCSLQCLGIFNRGKPTATKKNTQITKECEVCNIVFSCPRSHNNRRVCCSKECTHKRHSAKVGADNNPNWNGGLSRLPYPFNWAQISKRIRWRDGNKCMNPNCTNATGKGKIETHHIDHDKMNVSDSNLISLCSVCNSKANFNRMYWVGFYAGILRVNYPHIF